MSDPVDDPGADPGADPSPDAPVAEHHHHHHSRRTLALILIPIGILVVLSNIGDALAPSLLPDPDRPGSGHPLLLIALNARNRNLLAVTNHVDALGYYVVGTLRLLVADPPFFLLGRHYGDRAIAWVESKSTTYGRAMRQYEDAFRYAAYPLVFFAPNNPICLFAGAAGMRVRTFFVVNVTGTIVRLWLLRVAGDVFAGPIDTVLGFITRYRWQFTLASIGIVAFTLWNDRRTGGGELSEISELTAEDDEDDEDAAETAETTGETDDRPAGSDGDGTPGADGNGEVGGAAGSAAGDDGED